MTNCIWEELERDERGWHRVRCIRCGGMSGWTPHPFDRIFATCRSVKRSNAAECIHRGGHIRDVKCETCSGKTAHQGFRLRVARRVPVGQRAEREVLRGVCGRVDRVTVASTSVDPPQRTQRTPCCNCEDFAFADVQRAPEVVPHAKSINVSKATGTSPSCCPLDRTTIWLLPFSPETAVQRGTRHPRNVRETLACFFD